MNKIKTFFSDTDVLCAIIFGGLVGFALTFAFERVFGGW